jgi:hypothetical protein
VENINPIPEVSEAKASSLRKYFYEYVVIALVIAVVTLFGMYYNLNNFVVHSMNDVINHNTNVIEKNNDIINSLKK